MKKLLIGLSLIWFCLGYASVAQGPTPSVTISSTGVVDYDGTVWISGTWQVQFMPNPNNPNINIYNIGGVPLSPTILYQTGTLNGTTGAFTTTIYDNTLVAPSGSYWLLKVCPLASFQCSSYKFTAQGSAMDITVALNAVVQSTKLRFNAVAGAYGYADVEAVNTLPVGGTYWNVGTVCNNGPSQRYYNGTSWTCVGSGGGGGGTLTGTGTNGYVALWNAATNLTNSHLQDTGTALTSNLSINLTNATVAPAIVFGPTAVGAVVPANGSAWGNDTDFTTAGLYKMPVAPGTGLLYGVNSSSKVTHTYISPASYYTLGLAPLTAVNQTFTPGSILPTSTYAGMHNHGNSITNGVGATGGTGSAPYNSNAYTGILATTLGLFSSAGVNWKNYGVGGNGSCDVNHEVFNNETPSVGDGILRTLMIGLNDADGGGIGNYQSIANQCFNSAVTWMIIPSVQKATGSNTTPATNWSTDTTYSGVTGLTTTTQGASQTWLPVSACASDCPAPTVYVWYRCWDPGGSTSPGSFSVQVATGPVQYINSTNYPGMGTANGITDGVCVAAVGTAGGGPGTHSVVTQQYSTTGTTTSILAVGVGPDENPGMPLWVGGVTRNYDDTQGIATSTYNVMERSDISALKQLGFTGLNFVNTRNYWLSTAATMNSTAIGEHHPNNAGHALLAQAFLAQTANPPAPDIPLDPTQPTQRTVSSFTNCGLSATDQVVNIAVGGSGTGTCYLPDTSRAGIPKVIFLNVGGAQGVTLTALPNTNVTGSAVSLTIPSHAAAVLVSSGYQQWDAVYSPTSSSSDPTTYNVTINPGMPYTATATDDYIRVVASGTLTLPATTVAGKAYYIRNDSTGDVTISSSAGTANGAIIHPGGVAGYISQTATTGYWVALMSTNPGSYHPVVLMNASAGYTVGVSDEVINNANNTNQTITLPTTFDVSKQITVMQSGTGVTSFTGASCGNANSVTLAQNQSALLTTYGSGCWTAVAGTASGPPSSGNVATATQYSPGYYSSTTGIGGITPVNGLVNWSSTGPPSAYTTSMFLAFIGSLSGCGTAGNLLSPGSSACISGSGTGTVTSVGLALPSDFTITNSPVTASGTLTGAWATTPTGTGAIVRASSASMASLTLTGTTAMQGITGTNTWTDTITSNAALLKLVNSTTASSGACSAAPEFDFTGGYYTGSVGASDITSFKNTCVNGTNGARTLAVADTQGAGLFTMAVAGAITQQSVSTGNSAPLSSELTASGDTFTYGSDWTGNWTSGFTHAATGSSNLVDTTLAISSNTLYQATATITGYSAGTISITIGGVTSGTLAANGTLNWSPSTTSTGSFTVTPSSTFVGTVTVSVKTIGTMPAYYTLQDSTGASSIEMRATTNTLNNTYIGVNSGLHNTTGNGNVGHGVSALANNTTGSNNAAGGFQTCDKNTTGSYNTCEGSGSLYSNTGGILNGGFAYNAGRYLADGSTANSNPSNSTYLGAGSRSGGSGSATYETTVGANVTGNGNSSVTLGRIGTDTVYSGTLLVTGTELVTGAATFSANGAASTPGLAVTGTPFTGGTGTTTVPQFIISGGVTGTSWNTNGTMLGIIPPSGFAGDLLSIFNSPTNQAFHIDQYGDVFSGATIFSAGNVQAGSVSGFLISGRSVLSSPADGVSEFTNNAGTGFTRLDLGGTTSSFGGLQTNGTETDSELADGSGKAPFGASKFIGALYATATNCAGVGTSASPSIVSCSSAGAGAFSCAANASGATCTINDTAVTANSEISVWEVSDESTRLGVTCNTAPSASPIILLATKTAGTGFTINVPTITTNPACFNFYVIN